MDTSQQQSQEARQVQVQKIAPHLIQASEILQCTSQELTQAIDRELMENPALETLEGDNNADRCSDCDLPPSVCTNCPYTTNRLSLSDAPSDEPRADRDGAPATEPIFKEETSRDNDYEPDIEPEYDSMPLLSMSELADQHVKDEALEGAFDPLSLAPSVPSLRDHLVSRLRSLAPNEQVLRVCEYLLNCLDERGWLKIDRVDTMVALSITEDILDQAIETLQTCDPAGIGARDLQECLLLQLQQFEDEGAGNPLATILVKKYWELLTQRRYDLLARKTRSTDIAIADAVRYIQHELSPAPAAAYREPWNYKPDGEAEAVRADVAIRRTETGLEIEVSALDLPALHINARYRKMMETIAAGRADRVAVGASHAHPRADLAANGRSRLSQQEQKHIAQYVERANLFIKNIQQRKKTIERITRCLVETQQGFIETGARAFLVPMTRTDLAHRTGLHESTVSRALLRKFVQLPNQDVVAFDAFFAPAGSVKDIIANLIAEENPKMPLSDEALRIKLESLGTSIARRTIVKYREALRIPASYLRKTH